MKKLFLAIVLSLILATTAVAGDWEIELFGVKAKHFKGRDWKQITIGVVSALAVHEASHYLYGKIAMGSADWSLSDPTVVYVDVNNYNAASRSSQQMFHRAGFVGQILVGAVLTAIPATRHLDFTLGFNTGSMAQIAMYITTGGIDPASSDVKNLDRGYAEGSLYTVMAGSMALINLKGVTE